MPAKLVDRSGMSRLQEQLCCDCCSGPFAVGYGVHYFAAAVDAIAARIVFRIAGAAGGSIDRDCALIDLDGVSQHRSEASLAERGNHQVAGSVELASRN